MKKIVERLRSGGMRIKKTDLLVYAIGLMLVFSFATLLLVRPQVLAEKNIKGPTKKDGKVVTIQAVKTTSDSPISPALIPEAPKPVLKNSDSPSPVSDSQAPLASVSDAAVVTPTPIVVKNTATITIGGLGTYTVEINSGDTAFDVLKNAAVQNHFTLDYSVDPTYGVFINGINGIENNYSMSQYWSLYYNGTLAQVGVSSQSVSNNDSLEWRYEVLSW